MTHGGADGRFWSFILHALGLNHLDLTYLHNGRLERATINGGEVIQEAFA